VKVNNPDPNRMKKKVNLYIFLFLYPQIIFFKKKFSEIYFVNGSRRLKVDYMKRNQIDFNVLEKVGGFFLEKKLVMIVLKVGKIKVVNIFQFEKST